MDWIRLSRNDDAFADYAILGDCEIVIEQRSDCDYGSTRIKPFNGGYISLGQVAGDTEQMRGQAVALARAYMKHGQDG